MYKYGRDTAFIAHPKTGSQSAARILKESGWQKANNHHEIDFPLPLNIISVIREPEDWFVSWYYHNKTGEPFKDWFPGYVKHNEYARRGFYGLRFTTHLIFFEKLQEGFDAVFQDLGIPKVKLPHLNHKGRHGKSADLFFCDETRKLLDSSMVTTYTSLRNRLGNKPYLRIHQ